MQLFQGTKNPNLVDSPYACVIMPEANGRISGLEVQAVDKDRKPLSTFDATQYINSLGPGEQRSLKFSLDKPTDKSYSKFIRELIIDSAEGFFYTPLTKLHGIVCEPINSKVVRYGFSGPLTNDDLINGTTRTVEIYVDMNTQGFLSTYCAIIKTEDENKSKPKADKIHFIASGRHLVNLFDTDDLSLQLSDKMCEPTSSDKFEIVVNKIKFYGVSGFLEVYPKIGVPSKLMRCEDTFLSAFLSELIEEKIIPQLNYVHPTTIGMLLLPNKAKITEIKKYTDTLISTLIKCQPSCTECFSNSISELYPNLISGRNDVNDRRLGKMIQHTWSIPGSMKDPTILEIIVDTTGAINLIIADKLGRFNKWESQINDDLSVFSHFENIAKAYFSRQQLPDYLPAFIVHSAGPQNKDQFKEHYRVMLRTLASIEELCGKFMTLELSATRQGIRYFSSDNVRYSDDDNSLIVTLRFRSISGTSDCNVALKFNESGLTEWLVFDQEVDRKKDLLNRLCGFRNRIDSLSPDSKALLNDLKRFLLHGYKPAFWSFSNNDNQEILTKRLDRVPLSFFKLDPNPERILTYRINARVEAIWKGCRDIFRDFFARS